MQTNLEKSRELPGGTAPKTFTATVTLETLTIKAATLEEAEKKYDQYWTGQCQQHGTSFYKCECVTSDQDISHTMKEEK